MRTNRILNDFSVILTLLITFVSSDALAQSNNTAAQDKDEFWRHVQFGGGVGLGFGSGYTDISVSPSAIYNFNDYVALGAGLQYKYLKQRDFFASHLYGASAISLFNPLPEIQLSAEVEQLRVNVKLDGSNSNSQNYWNTALFVGAGYRSSNATLGVRYNVLTDKNNIYGSAFMPFIRFYF